MLVLKTGMLEAGFLYQDGGKMATLKDVNDGTEFLSQTEGEKYLHLEYDGDYVASECSGFDDMFPTIDPYTPQSGLLEGRTYPDHGEICRVQMTNDVKRTGMTFTYRSDEFKYTYQKSVYPLKDGSIEIKYHIANQSTEPFSCLWAGHCMLQGIDGAKIFTSYPAQTPRVQMFGPDDIDPDMLSPDSLTGFVPDEGHTYKFYYLERMPEGRFGVLYPDGKRLTFRTDGKLCSGSLKAKRATYNRLMTGSSPSRSTIRLLSQTVTTPGSQSGNAGSTPAGATTYGTLV